MKRGISMFTLFALLFVAIASVASAGGWAVVTLDALPANLVVNEPIQVGMTIRQHGRTPWVYDNVRVRGFHSTGETFVTRAEMDDRGHYTATLNFPRAGTWQWAVSSGLMPEWQTMPELQVANSAQDEALFVEASAQQMTNPMTLASLAPPMLLLALGVLGFLGSGGGLIYWWRARRAR